MGTFEGPPIVTAPSPPPIPYPVAGPIIASGPGVDPGSITAALGKVVAFASAIESYLTGYDDSLLSQLKDTLKNIFGSVLSWLRRIAHSWLGQTVKNLWQRAVKIFKAVAGELRLIQKTIRQYEQLVKHWQDRIMKPALDLMQRIRGVLVIFRLFHFKFAIKLDNYLAKREAAIAHVMIASRRDLNRVLDYLNLIFDPFGYFNQGIFLATAIQSIGGLWSAIVGFPGVSITPDQRRAQSATAHQYDANQVYKTAAIMAATGPTPSQQNDQAAVARALEAMGYNL